MAAIFCQGTNISLRKQNTHTFMHFLNFSFQKKISCQLQTFLFQENTPYALHRGKTKRGKFENPRFSYKNRAKLLKIPRRK